MRGVAIKIRPGASLRRRRVLRSLCVRRGVRSRLRVSTPSVPRTALMSRSTDGHHGGRAQPQSRVASVDSECLAFNWAWRGLLRRQKDSRPYTPTPLLDPIQSNPCPLTNHTHTPQEMATHTAPAARRPRCQPRLRLLPAPLLLSLAAALLAAVLAPARAQVVRDNQGGHPTTTTTTTITTTTTVAASSATPAAASAGQALLRKARLRRDRGTGGGRLGAYDEELADAMVDFAGAWRPVGLI